MKNDPVTVGESVPDRKTEIKRGSARLPESIPLKAFLRIRRCFFVSALLAGSISLITSCGNGSDTSDNTAPEERSPAGDQGDQSEVNLPLSAENDPITEAGKVQATSTLARIRSLRIPSRIRD